MTMLAMAVSARRLLGQSENGGQPSVALPIIGGLLAGGAGVVGGALIGLSIECDGPCDDSDDFEGLEGAIIGALVGETLLYPIGVHIGNGGRGSLVLDFATSIGITGASLAGTYALDAGELAFLGMMGQLIGTVMVERASGTVRSSERAVRLSVSPTADGMLAVRASIAF